MSYGEAWRAHFRLAILRLMLDQPSWTLNAALVHSVAPRLGFSATRDQVEGELVWLEEQGLVDREDVHGLTVASLTIRGKDVADGRGAAAGVERPSPRRPRR